MFDVTAVSQRHKDFTFGRPLVSRFELELFTRLPHLSRRGCIMPQLTTAQSYNAALPPASTAGDVDFWSNPSSRFRSRPVAGRKSPSRRHGRNYRALLWGVAAWLKAFGILGTFLVAICTGWFGIAGVAATLAGLSLRYVLEATSQGD